jgi:hypothetical protein
MLDTFLAMLAILATWLVWASAFVSLGAAILPSGTTRPNGRDDGATRWLVWFWVGWCAAVLCLQVWHLFLPVDVRAAGAILATAVVAAVCRGRVLAESLSIRSVPRYVLYAAIGVVVVWSNLATGEIRITDTGLYHMQAARWNAAYPIMPGLGNLHGRLAYNNSSLLYAALVDVGPWSHRGHHIANGLLSLGVLLPLIASVPKAMVIPVRNVDLSGWARHVARSLLIAPTALHAYKHATSLSPDLAATLLGIVLAIVLIDLCVERACGSTTMTSALVFLALVAATAVTVKLSMIATGATAALVALVATRADWKRWLLTAAIFVAAVGPWCVRGVVLSGYLAYPAQVVAFDVEWRVSQEWAEEDRRTIVAWARDPDRPADEVLGNVRWIGRWFVRETSDLLGVAAPSAILLACGVITVRYRRVRCRRLDRPAGGETRLSLWPASVPFVAALAFMFFTAPDISRFGGASVWAIAVIAVTIQFVRLRRYGPDAAFRRFTRAATVLGIVLATVAAVKAGRYVRFAGGLAPIPKAELRVVRTPFGLDLNVPTDSDRGWDAPLPSTPYPKPQLKPRSPNDLSAGFVHQEGGP